MTNKFKPFTIQISIWDLIDWANEELRSGNRIKASKISRIADKYNKIHTERK